jgi:hypothetical protein
MRRRSVFIAVVLAIAWLALPTPSRMRKNDVSAAFPWAGLSNLWLTD